MRYRIEASSETPHFPTRLWICLGVLFLCSCRSITPQSADTGANLRTQAAPVVSSNAGGFGAMHQSSPVRQVSHQSPVATARTNSAGMGSAGMGSAGMGSAEMGSVEMGGVPAETDSGANRFQLSDQSEVQAAVQAAAGIRPRGGRRLTCPACGVENCQQHLCLPDSAIYLPPALRPKDEYLCDGGDRMQPVMLDHHGLYQGMDLEDTVATYRSSEGDVKVEASNKVCIYAPRFSSVRKITGVSINEQKLFAATMRERLQSSVQQRNLKADFVRQRDELATGRKLVAANDLHSHLGADVSDSVIQLRGVHRNLLPYENTNMVRTGQLDDADKPKLAKHIQSAIAWTANEGVQVAIKGFQLHEAVAGKTTNDMHVYEMPDGKPHLRIAKLASTDNALPGESVEFTIRFDNLGDQPLEEVTIVDNLTPRLALVEDSVKASVDAEFSKATNEGDSLMLRWKLKQPLQVNEGGVIHFKCEVR